MTEHDLRNLLLEYEATTTGSKTDLRQPGALGKWLVRLWTAVTVLMWVVAVAAVALYLILTLGTIKDLVFDKPPSKSEHLFELAVIFAIVEVLSIVVATGSTLVLVFVSRAARLRRINASLFELFGKLLEQKRNQVKRE